MSLLHFLLCALILFKPYYSLKCGAHTIPKFKRGEIDTKKFLSKNEVRRLDGSVVSHPIEIYIDTNPIKNYEHKDILEGLLRNVTKMFKSLIKVKRNLITNLKLNNDQLQTCYMNPTDVDTKITGDGVQADLILFPRLNSSLDGTEVQASATYCIQDTTEKYPIAGFVNINPELKLEKKNFREYFEILLFHEITHVLVFFEGLFNFIPPKVRTEIKKINGVDKILVKSPKVMEKAIKHFDCDTLDGVPLEDQGGEGSANSHWDARVMLGDYMISTDYQEVVISDITLALFEDSGWYEANYYTGGLFKFGKGMGCSFITSKCINSEKTDYYNDFCLTGGAATCSSSRTSKGVCYIYESKSVIQENYKYWPSSNRVGFEPADFCPVSMSNSGSSDYYADNCYIGNYNAESTVPESLSEHSFCVLSSLSDIEKKQEAGDTRGKFRAACHEFICEKTTDGIKYAIIKIGEKEIACPPEGGQISVKGYEGFLLCPDVNLICTGSTMCNSIHSCIEKKSTPDDDSYIYDYIPETTQETTNLEGKGLQEQQVYIKMYKLLLGILILALYI